MQFNQKNNVTVYSLDNYGKRTTNINNCPLSIASTKSEVLSYCKDQWFLHELIDSECNVTFDLNDSFIVISDNRDFPLAQLIFNKV